jgi:hypothetical protein
VFIVQCTPRSPEGITKIAAATRSAALEIASDFVHQGMRLVTVSAGECVYTAQEFAATATASENHE